MPGINKHNESPRITREYIGLTGLMSFDVNRLR